MEVASLLIIGGVSTIGMGAVARISYTLGFTGLTIFKRKKKKKELKNKLYQSIKNIDHLDFVNTIYEIKNYDEKYDKNLFIKVQKQFFFNNTHINSKDKFLKRFDDSYTNSDEELRRKIHTEISLILSQTKDRLDL